MLLTVQYPCVEQHRFTEFTCSTLLHIVLRVHCIFVVCVCEEWAEDEVRLMSEVDVGV